MSKGLIARTTAPVSATAQRDELVRKKEEAYRLYTEHTRKRQEAERVMGQLKRELDSGDENDDLPGAYELAAKDYDRSLAKANVQLDKTKGLEAELESLYNRDFAAFATEASKVSDMAKVACDDFIAAWRRAQAAWQAASEAWAPLCRAVRISGVGGFPVSEHQLSGVLNGEYEPTPPGVEIFDGDVLVD